MRDKLDVYEHVPIVVWSPDTGAIDGWSAQASDGSFVELHVEHASGGRVLRIDYRLGDEGAWIIARRDISAALPAHFAGVLKLRGAAPANALQVKLVDPSGANVWWWRRRDFEFPSAPTRWVMRKAGLEFAWGPLGGGYPDRIGAVELAVAAGRAGSGTLWIEDMRIEPRRPSVALSIRSIEASSYVAEHSPAHVIARDERATWRPETTDTAPWLVCDLGDSCEWGGVVVTFADACPGVRLWGSDDATTWTALAEAPAGAKRRVWLRTAEGEGRYLRLGFAAGSMPVVARVRVVPLELALAPARYAAALARSAPRGRYPRHLLGEQGYWAVVGADGDEHKALLGEDGALEVDVETFSIEPFLETDGATTSWADVECTASLADGCLPIPSVHWHTPDLRLGVTAFCTGAAGGSTLVARYEVTNVRAERVRMRLVLAIRPFQVNPAWQSLNLVGAVAPIHTIRRDADRVRVNGTREVILLAPPAAFEVSDGDLAEPGSADGSRRAADIEDPTGLAEGRLVYELDLPPQGSARIAVAVPYASASARPPSAETGTSRSSWADDRLEATVATWRERLSRVPVQLPPCAAAFEHTLRASIAWILVNRVGPRIQPGPRCYRRSWIRDGALTGAALAEMGFGDELRDFLRWYAPFQLDDGRVPCAVDAHGVDHVAEHDSHGQLAWGIVEHFRLTGDTDSLRELWPVVAKAAGAIEALRAQRTTDAFRGTRCFGLLPESISHEGYSSRPVHSYWDDFFALRGLGDAAFAARVLGNDVEADRFARLRDEMREDVHASIRRTIAEAGLDFIPGSAELADFDPTSTAIAFDPCDEADHLPAVALAHTFDRYWRELAARRGGDVTTDAYTAYEVRTASALVLLGRKERAYELLAWLISDQRLAAWREWPEISWRDRRAPRFVGDIPHGWVASSFVRALRRMLAFERTADRALVLAAGVPEHWVCETPGIRVCGLPTHFGRLDFTMRADGEKRVAVTLGGSVRVPEAGIVIESPYAAPIRSVLVDGARVSPSDPHRFVVRATPATLTLEY
jgi:hypothetical protein